MGYYSDVAIAIYNKDFREMCRQIAEMGEASRCRALLINAEIDIHGEERDPDAIITMMWHSIKWYDDFEGVKFIMGFIRSDGVKYAYKRLGENYDDYEESCDDSYELDDVFYFERYLDRKVRGNLVNAEDFLDDANEQNQSNEEPLDLGMEFDDVFGG